MDGGGADGQGGFNAGNGRFLGPFGGGDLA